MVLGPIVYLLRLFASGACMRRNNLVRDTDAIYSSLGNLVYYTGVSTVSSTTVAPMNFMRWLVILNQSLVPAMTPLSGHRGRLYEGQAPYT